MLPACADPAGPSRARDLHGAAALVYDKEGVIGSPEKDVVGQNLFQAIGAEVDSGPSCVSRGCVPAAAPLSRRLPLAALSLRAAKLSCISKLLLSRLAGAWVSVAMFRRCCVCLFNEVFPASLAKGSPQRQHAIPQSRTLAQELCLLLDAPYGL